MAKTTTTDQTPERFDPRAADRSLMASEHLLRYRWASQLAVGREVLDAGCGTGYGSQILARAGAARVAGVDVSAEAFAEIQREDKTIEFVEADVRDLPFPDAEFDLVICFEVIEHVEGRDAMVRELKRVLRPDGVLVVSSPNRETYPTGNPHHVFEYLPEELRDEVARVFENVRLYRQDALLASAIFTAEDESPPKRSVETRLPERAEAGKEAYAIAVASDARLPSLADQTLLGDSFEVGWWQRELAQTTGLEAEARAEAARAQALAEHDVEAANERARRAEKALIDVESERAKELEELREARTEREAMEQIHDRAQQTIQAMQRTRVWRLGTAYWRVRDRLLRRRDA